MIALDDLRDLPPRRQAEEVNARVNRAIRYVADVEDYWQAPEETFERGAGDCEDFALAKMACLQRLGWRESKLRLVYCRRSLGRIEEAHLVLEASIGGEAWILDNLGIAINTWDGRPDLNPLFRFNQTGLWVKGRKTSANPLERLGQWRAAVDRAGGTFA